MLRMTHEENAIYSCLRIELCRPFIQSTRRKRHLGNQWNILDPRDTKKNKIQYGGLDGAHSAVGDEETDQIKYNGWSFL